MPYRKRAHRRGRIADNTYRKVRGYTDKSPQMMEDRREYREERQRLYRTKTHNGRRIADNKGRS